MGYGTSGIMDEAESLGLHYLFKLARTQPMKERFRRLCDRDGWLDASEGWQGRFESLKLGGWSHARRCLFLRRPVRRTPGGSPADPDDASRQLILPSSEEWGLDDPADKHRAWDFCVLVTDMPGFDAVALSQLYRDRGGHGRHTGCLREALRSETARRLHGRETVSVARRSAKGHVPVNCPFQVKKHAAIFPLLWYVFPI